MAMTSHTNSSPVYSGFDAMKQKHEASRTELQLTKQQHQMDMDMTERQMGELSQTFEHLASLGVPMAADMLEALQSDNPMEKQKKIQAVNDKLRMLVSAGLGSQGPAGPSSPPPGPTMPPTPSSNPMPTPENPQPPGFYS